MAMAQKKIKVKLVKSTNGCKAGHRATVTGLGLKRLNHTVELIDTPAVRGMIERVSYLVRIEG
jgi:large subunit ribosomal protein L30